MPIMFTPIEVADQVHRDYDKGSVSRAESIQRMRDALNVTEASAADLIDHEKRPSARLVNNCPKCGYKAFDA